MSDYGKIYIGSILLEPNRWSREKSVSYQLSNWAGRFNADGFDGVELWEYHATMVDEGELGKLDGSECPISIFNSYAAMTDADQARRDANTDIALRYGSGGIKFNVGSEESQRDEYLKNTMKWRDKLDGKSQLLCECHPGTIIEEPQAAKKFFDVAGLDGIGIIVHAFNAVDTLADWFKAFGPKIQHAHLQMRDADNKMVNFGDDLDCVKKAVEIMKGEGFNGSFTLEFTKGTLTESDNPDYLYQQALADFEVLNEYWN